MGSEIATSKIPTMAIFRNYELTGFNFLTLRGFVYENATSILQFAYDVSWPSDNEMYTIVFML